MSGKIIVGFNGSEESRDALELGRRLGRPEDAELIVVASFDYSSLEVGVEAHEKALAEDSEALFQEAREALQGLEVTTRAVGGSSPARALHDVADAQEAEAIVLGSTHRGKLGRVLPGSVGERLLEGAPCSIVVAPREFARGEHFGLGVIGVGYDGNDESKIALREAERLATRLGGTLRVITAVAPVEPSPYLSPDRSTLRQDLQQRLEQAAASLGAGAKVETVLVDGDPAAVLADQGVELDLLVLGSRGYGPLRRALLGGVSATVIRTAPCPVWLTPRGAAAAERPSAG